MSEPTTSRVPVVYLTVIALQLMNYARETTFAGRIFVGLATLICAVAAEHQWAARSPRRPEP